MSDRSRSMIKPLVALLALIVVAWLWLAPTPDVFAGVENLDDALARGAELGRPVLVVATSDFCFACQAYKRGALADPAVQAWLGARTVPVLTRIEWQGDDAERLGRSFGPVPATILLVDGQPVATLEGGPRADQLLEWLESHAGTQPAPPREETAAMTPAYNPLTPQEAHVLLERGTERAFTGEYTDNKAQGTYVCRRCNAALYESKDKFDSRCGWPSFDDEIDGAVLRKPDADGRRTEIVCQNCGGHLGHVFFGEGFTDKDTRHCVNSISMRFYPVGSALPAPIVPGRKG